MPKLFVTRRLPLDPASLLEDEIDCVVFPHDRAPTRAELLEGSEDADAMISLLSDSIDAEFFGARPKLRAVANYAVGYDNIDIKSAERNGVWVTNTPGVLTEATADIAWTLLLGVGRRVVEGDRLVRAGEFHGWSPTMLLGKELSGSTMGVFGFGRIGQAVAHRARGFGMKVIFNSRSPVPMEIRYGIDAEVVTKEELLRRADVISVHTPLNKASRHAFGGAEFVAMKDDAILINTARGPVVDEAALVQALEEGQIAGAGLDVYEDEPKVHQGLLGRSDVVLLPHLGSATHATRHKMVKIAVDNIVAAIREKTPKNAVNNPRASLKRNV